MSSPGKPRGGRPMPMSNGGSLNVPSTTSMADTMADPPSLYPTVNLNMPTRPKLGVSLPGSHLSLPNDNAANGPKPSSLRPQLSLVYGNSASTGAVPVKPSLKLGLKLGAAGAASTPKLGLAIPAPLAGASGGNSPLESYYGIIPGSGPSHSIPEMAPGATLTSPPTETYSAETMKPPIATILPGQHNSRSAKEETLDDIHKAIEAIQLNNNDPDVEKTWNNDMFETLRRLGEGAGGAVYQVKQKSTGKMMAMKTIPANPETPPRQLRRELDFLSTCVHPNITEFYGAYLSSPSQHTADVVLLMEFCEGGSLETVSKKVRQGNRRIGESIVAKLAEGTLKGLDYLHGRKIIHRDIKPSNILLTKEGVVKLCDFGVSGVLINSLAGTFTGTSWYMSPERIRGDPYSIRSDVWSTGLTLLELARNKFPFPADLGPIELLSVIVNGDIPELEDEPPGPEGQPGAIWSEGMKMFIKRCLIISGTNRPTPKEILQDPWLLENQKIDIEMDKWMRQVYGWPKTTRKGPRRTKNAEGGASTPGGSIDATQSHTPIPESAELPDVGGADTRNDRTSTPTPSTTTDSFDSPMSVRTRYRRQVFLPEPPSPSQTPPP